MGQAILTTPPGIRKVYALYENIEGTRSTITLEDNVNNYDYIRVFYGMIDIHSSADFCPKLNTGTMNYLNISLQYCNSSSTTLFVRSSLLNIVDTTITFGRESMVRLNIGGDIELSNSEDEYLKVFGVYGFKI